MYRVFLERAAVRDLRRLPARLHNRIISAIQALTDELVRAVAENCPDRIAIGEFVLAIIASFTKSMMPPSKFESIALDTGVKFSLEGP